MTEALFAIPASCGSCGRPETSSGCAWCATRTGLQAQGRAVTAIRRDPEWQARADDWLRELRDFGETGFLATSDALVEAIGLPDGSPNQVGAIFPRWARKGWVKAAGHTQATRKEAHGRWVRTWAVQP